MMRWPDVVALFDVLLPVRCADSYALSVDATDSEGGPKMKELIQSAQVWSVDLFMPRVRLATFSSYASLNHWLCPFASHCTEKQAKAAANFPPTPRHWGEHSFRGGWMMWYTQYGER